MARKRLFSIIIALLIFQISAQAQSLLVQRKSILSKAFPEYDFNLVNDKIRTVDIQGRAMGITLTSHEFKIKDKNYLAMVLEFAEYQEKAVMHFQKTHKYEKPKHQNALIIAELTPVVNVTKIVIDPNCLGSSHFQIKTDDFIGNKSTQLLLKCSCVYGFSNPFEFRDTERNYLFILPEGKLSFRATVKMISYTETGIKDAFRRDIVFKDADKDGVNEIQITTIAKGKTPVKENITFQNGNYQFKELNPWERAGKDIPVKDKLLKLRIVDKDKKPIKGAKIEGYIYKVNIFTLSDSSNKIELISDRNGLASIEVLQAVNITISADGYYSCKKYWKRPQIPSQVFEIVMEKEHTPVPMIKCDRIRKIWEQDADIYETGIVFIHDDRKSKTMAQIVVDDIDRADIWVKINKDKDKNWTNWIINISSKKGWTFAPGPLKDNSIYGESMRIAPDRGYTKEMKYTIQECPEGIYLQLNDSQKYGKLWGLRFKDRSKNKTVQRYLWVKFMVHEKDGLNTRSLNPKK